ncbi:protein NO VEIN domain-containing protein [Amycolatopsis sp. lyj-90]|uniref:protein NO VEIN domain-containing protein n=1 Tax=Amycolatopsis sp. lyj-90 TaxID=2789285 RepID=UPI0039785D79
MAYTDVTTEAVLKTLAEYDSDPGAFFATYGFDVARQYELVHDGKRYPSKAIVGVAHRYIDGHALRPGDFTGGRATVKRHLERLGFAVETTRPVLMVYVGQDSLENLQHGLDTCTWGFRELPDDLSGATFDFVVFAEGASPRVTDEQWFSRSANLHICQATSSFYPTEAKHWPDELDQDQLIYPYHFGIIPLGTAADVPLGPDGPLPAEASRQLKVSGTHRGFGKIAHFDPIHLFTAAHLADAVTLPDDPKQHPTIKLARAPGARLPQPGAKSRRATTSSGPGRLQDPKKRKAVEQHAVTTATTYYEKLGWHVTELGKPYDLKCRRKGEELHVEVKGTTGAAAAVELTVNEVNHAHGPDVTDLFVVSEIIVNDSYETSGGKTHIFENWTPNEDALQPIRFRYELPQPPKN